MRKKNYLSTCVIFLFLTEFSFALSWKSLPAKDYCAVSFSPRMSEENRESVREFTSEYFGGSCSMGAKDIEDIFQDHDWSLKSGIGFWVGTTKNAQEILIRAFDLESGLQLGQEKASVARLTLESANLKIKSLMETILSQSGFAGFIKKDGYFLWQNNPLPNRFYILKRNGHSAHPFIPALLNMEGEWIKDSDLKFEKGMLITSTKFNLDTSDSLWLKAVE